MALKQAVKVRRESENSVSLNDVNQMGINFLVASLLKVKISLNCFLNWFVLRKFIISVPNSVLGFCSCIVNHQRIKHLPILIFSKTIIRFDIAHYSWRTLHLGKCILYTIFYIY